VETANWSSRVRLAKCGKVFSWAFAVTRIMAGRQYRLTASDERKTAGGERRAEQSQFAWPVWRHGEE
jgi:hypothetical protein